MLLVGAYQASALCCCCCAPLQLSPERQRRFRVRFFTAAEEQQLIHEATAWQKNTGRSCGDFFKTMRLPGNPEAALAGRPTLLAKVRNLNAGQALLAANTICARVSPPTRPTVLLPIPPAPSLPLRYEAFRFEVSGFGFSRPTLGRFATLAEATAAALNFTAAQRSGSLEGATVRDLGL